MDKKFNDLNSYFKNKFGFRVHKITVDAGFNCPNRDGTISFGGCVFCNSKGSGTGFLLQGISIKDQILRAKKYVVKRFKAKKFIAYFQAFTNTYAPLEKLKDMYDEALGVEDVIGLSIGTRPDCVDNKVLDLLQEYAKKNLIWIEYGMQTSKDETLKIINRGHDYACLKKAVEITKDRGIKICVHAILGLPGETKEDMLETADAISRLSVNGVKLHVLYIIKNTELENMYNKGLYKCLTQKEYVETVVSFIERLPENIIIQRLTGEPHPRELVGPYWALNKKLTLELIKSEFIKRDTWQGKFSKV